MSRFLSLMMNGSVLLGLAALSILSIRLIFQPDELAERWRRLSMYLAATMTFFLSKITGISVPDLLFGAMTTGAAWLFQQALAALFSLAAGVFVSRFLLRAAANRRNPNLAFRLMLFLSALILLSFIDLYVAMEGADPTTAVTTQLLPNLSFLLGILLYVGLDIDIPFAIAGRRNSASKKINWRDLV